MSPSFRVRRVSSTVYVTCSFQVIPTRPPTPEMVRLAMSMLKTDSKIRRRISQSAAELSYRGADPDGGSDPEDVEIALATDNLLTSGGSGLPDTRVPTPEPIRDVTAEIVRLAGDTTATDKPSQQTDNDGSRKSTTRRRRSQVNEPDRSSSSGSETGGSGRNSAVRVRRKRTARPSSQINLMQSAGQWSQPASVGPPEILTPQNQLEATARSSPNVFGSLANLKRRFVGAPRVHPISGDGLDPVEDPEEGGSKPSVFAFEKTAGSAPRSRRESQSKTKMSTASFSDYEFGANLSDNFAGVTFSQRH